MKPKIPFPTLSYFGCLGIGVIAVVLIYLFFKFSPYTISARPPQETVSFATTIDKIEAIGRMELVRYRLQDVVEVKKSSGTDWLPDASVLLVVTGEVVGCLDMAKIKQEDVSITGDTVTIQLPAPEICYFKVDHQNSKVYDTRFTRLMGESGMVADAFKKAEKQIEETARKSGILEQTKNNAQLILKPMLENITGKKVFLVFAPENTKIELKK